MSHFSVLVVTDKAPTNDVISEAMQPYHEFECTGVDDKYVQDIDITEQCRSEYQSDTVPYLVSPSGERQHEFDDRFYRDPTKEEQGKIGPIAGTGTANGLFFHSKDWGDGKGYRAKVKFTPDGWVSVSLPKAEVMTFEQFIADHHSIKSATKHYLTASRIIGSSDFKYGYAILDDHGEITKVIRRTNPNKKWDGWRIGGRYAGRLQSITGSTAMSAPTSWEWEADKIEPPKGFDVCQKKDVDFARMHLAAIHDRNERVAELSRESGLTVSDISDGIQQSFEADEKWQMLDEPKPRGADYYEWAKNEGFFCVYSCRKIAYGLPELERGQSLGEWVSSAPALSTFAYVKDGQWFERGRMGWFASVSNERNASEWQAQFDSMLKSIPDNHWLTIVDCHI